MLHCALLACFFVGDVVGLHFGEAPSGQTRLFSLGTDKRLVEYDLTTCTAANAGLAAAAVIDVVAPGGAGGPCSMCFAPPMPYYSHSSLDTLLLIAGEDAEWAVVEMLLLILMAGLPEQHAVLLTFCWTLHLGHQVACHMLLDHYLQMMPTRSRLTTPTPAQHMPLTWDQHSVGPSASYCPSGKTVLPFSATGHRQCANCVLLHHGFDVQHCLSTGTALACCAVPACSCRQQMLLVFMLQ